MVVGRTTSRPAPIDMNLAPASLPDFLDWVDELTFRKADLHPLVNKIAKEKFELQSKLNDAREVCHKLRNKVRELTGPQHFPAVVTGVRHTGVTRAEVYCGGSRVNVSVSSDVSRDLLKIGTQAILSHDRNCLIGVEGEPVWKDIGTFEGYTDQGRRLLLKYQDRLVAAVPSTDLKQKILNKGDLIGFDHDGSKIAFSRILGPPEEDLFHTDTPSDRFEELGGLDREIALLKRLVQFRIQNPETAKRYQLSSKHGVLFEGPPGNGKTKLARCLARYIADANPTGQCRFMAISGSADYSMWLGQSEKKIRDRFSAAREMATRDGVPVVMFFDEIDAIGRRRGTDHGNSSCDRILATLLAELDGIGQISNLIVVGATNRADVLDSGLTRPGRLGDIKIQIPPPNRVAARMILTNYLRELPLADGTMLSVDGLLSRIYSPRGEFSELVRVTLRDGRRVNVGGPDLISGAMLENVVSMASEAAAVREVDSGRSGIHEEDLCSALRSEFYSVARLLTASNVRNYALQLPQDMDPVAVDPIYESSSGADLIPGN